LVLFSCRNNSNEEKSIFESDNVYEGLEINVSKPTQVHEDFSLPLGLFNGQVIIIDYVSFGCFHYQHEVVRIKRVDNNYILNCFEYVGNKEVQVIADSLMDRSFETTLKRFGKYCASNILQSRKDSSDHPQYFSTEGKSISINNGLYIVKVPFPIERLLTPYSLIGDMVSASFLK